MKKKMASIFLAAILLFSMLALPASAAKEKEINYEGRTCTVCAEGVLRRQPDEYGKWHKVGYTNCVHDLPASNDWVYDRAVTKIYKCDVCGCKKLTYSTETKYKHQE